MNLCYLPAVPALSPPSLNAMRAIHPSGALWTARNEPLFQEAGPPADLWTSLPGSYWLVAGAGLLLLLAVARVAYLWGRSEGERRARSRDRAERRALLADAGDIHLRVDVEIQTIQEANPAAAEAFGVPSRELVGRSLTSLLSGSSASRVRQLRETLMAHGTASGIPLTARRPSGERLDMEASATELRREGGETYGYDLLLRDVSEREARGRMLRLFRLSLDRSDDPVLWLDEERTVIYANPAVDDLLGLELDDILGQPVSHVTGDHIPGLDALLDRVDRNGNAQEEALIPRREGAPVPVRLTASRVQGDDTSFLSLQIRDLTEERAREAEQRIMNRQLQTTEHLRGLATLSGGIAHQFNNLLARILGFAEILGDQFEPDDPSRRYLEEVEEAALRAGHLTRQLQSFSHAFPGGTEKVELSRVVQRAADRIRPYLDRETKLELETHSRATAAVHVERLEEAIYEMLDNARFAIGDGPGRIRVVTEDVVLNEPESVGGVELAAGSYLELRIADTGEGIDPSILPRIFEPFFTTREEEAAVGLGLSAAHGTFVGLGGTLDVASDPGEGSEFRALLPTFALRADPAMPPPEESLRPRRVLVVDDQPQVSEIAGLHLQAMGHSVHVEAASQQALSLFREDPEAFDLVLTDYSMPELSGLELIRALREIRPDLPVILMTGFDENLRDQKGPAMKRVHLLRKPFRRAQLKEALQAVLH